MATSTPFPSLTKIWHTSPSPAISPSRPELSAKGKVVAITGGGSGIGASIARAFAEAGASAVAIIGRREKALLDTKASIEASIPGSDIFSVTGDIVDAESINAAFKEIYSHFGQVNVYVSNAGYLPEPATAGSTSIDDWWHGFEINARGALTATQAFLRVAASNATVIDISSAIAHVNPIPGFPSYSASKLAGTKFFDYLQAEYPHLHIVHVQPGVVETAMSVKSKMPAMDDPKLPGNFVAWLSSSEAAFLKGKYTYVNWDIDELKTKADEIQNSNLLTLSLDGLPAKRADSFTDL